MADPCVTLDVAVQDCVEQREADLSRSQWEYILRVTGLDFIVDFFEQDELDKLISLFFLLLQGGGAVDTIKTIVRLIRKVLGRVAKSPKIPPATRFKLLRGIGKWLGRILGWVGAAIFVYEVVVGWYEWKLEDEKVNQRTDDKLRLLYHGTDCETRDAVFAKHGAAVPR